MNCVAEVVATEAVALRRFDHAPGVPHRDPERERASGYGVNFVESGAFRARTRGGWREIGGTSLFVTTPGLEFSCAHDDEYPRDRCLSVAYSADAVEREGFAAALAGAFVRPLTNRQAFLRLTLRECGAGDAARAEALAGALLEALAAPRPPLPLFSADRLSWYARRVDRAKAMIAARYAEPLSLSIVARDAGMSVFHFARVFAELEGQTPHRYLRDVRLTHARCLLRQGAGVTETCFAVGFGSLSHFVTTFRRRYGVTPSELGRGGSRVER